MEEIRMGTRAGGTLVAVFMVALLMPPGSASAQTADPSPNAEVTGPVDGTEAQTPESGQGGGALLRIFGGQLTYRNELFYELGNEGPSGSLFNPYHSVLGVASLTNLFRINTALAFETDRYNVKAKLGAQYSDD